MGREDSDNTVIVLGPGGHHLQREDVPEEPWTRVDVRGRAWGRAEHRLPDQVGVCRAPGGTSLRVRALHPNGNFRKSS